MSNVNEIAVNALWLAGMANDLRGTNMGDGYMGQVAYAADRIIALRTAQLVEQSAADALDARDNANLRAYGLREVL
jgi:hypothetical protein